ncbi:hypothetical protein [Maricaulis sp.]|uniref:hypothetical protein n=1 Tax=Maricaulis sp. TaxID=1486257 RepID=UPI001B2E1D9C|nr:hypothetical protein [Maricaulis sp.]MBO6764470.1 hypothetical protein [Maricaulis sp.]
MSQPVILALSLLAASSTAQEEPACRVDPSPYLEMEVDAFDQSETGWRGIARQRCYAEAADLIGLYVADRVEPDDRLFGQLVWHQAQMEAHAGDYDAALPLFRQSRAINIADGHTADILMADASIAFLEGDIDALHAARTALLDLPEPDGFADTIARFRENYPDRPPPTWPLNLNIFDRLIACFGYSYEVAYAGRCETAETGADE